MRAPMARFYADKQFSRAATNYLRLIDHDVLTRKEAGRLPDDHHWD
jgi:hypothetical protein